MWVRYIDMAKEIHIPKEFSYIIGRPWSEHDPEHISAYALMSSQVFFGTRKDAKETKKLIETRNPDRKYKIYKLVEWSKDA